MRIQWMTLVIVGVASCAPAPEDDATETESEALTCGKGFILECNDGCSPGEPCPKPKCRCLPIDPQAVTGPVVVRYLVTHVVYAVPGAESWVSYSSGSTFGATTSTSSSFKGSNKITAEGKWSIGLGGDATVSWGHDWGSTDTSVTDLQIRETNETVQPGHSDFVDHDDDQIWFLLQPRLLVTITPKIAGRSGAVSWQLDPSQKPRRFHVRVKELKHPCMMASNTRDTLERAGIKEKDYAQLLLADPFATGNTWIDPDRFTPVDGNFTYVQRSSPDATPSSEAMLFQKTDSMSTVNSEEYSNTVDIDVQGGVQFGELFKLTARDQFHMTWSYSTSTKTTFANEKADTLHVVQPAFAYDGPQFVDVYQDRLWKTYLFVLRCADGSTSCGPINCSAEGAARCRKAGASWCEARPGQWELCRWEGGTATQVGGAARTVCGDVDPATPVRCDYDYGIWTDYDSGFAVGNPGSVPRQPGACITQVPNLCAPGSFDACKQFGASSCEVITHVNGVRYDLCRWVNTPASDCGTVGGVNSRTGNVGIWTPAGSGFDINNPGAVPRGTNGACITMVSNLGAFTPR